MATDMYGRPVKRDPMTGRPVDNRDPMTGRPVTNPYANLPYPTPNQPSGAPINYAQSGGGQPPSQPTPYSPSPSTVPPGGYMPSGYDMPSNLNTKGFQTPYGTSMDGFRNSYESGSQAVDTLLKSMPGYQGIMEIDPATGKPKVGDMYKYDPSQSDAFNKMKGIGMSEGPSELYTQQANLIDQGRSRDVDSLQQQADTAYGQGLGNLALSGGLESGARERLASSNSLERMRGTQDLYGGAADARARAGVGDAEMKVNILQGVGQAENNANMWNANQAIGDRQGFNDFNANMYQSTGDIIGSNEIAKSMPGGGGGGAYGSYSPYQALSAVKKKMKSASSGGSIVQKLNPQNWNY